MRSVLPTLKDGVLSKYSRNKLYYLPCMVVCDSIVKYVVVSESRINWVVCDSIVEYVVVAKSRKHQIIAY